MLRAPTLNFSEAAASALCSVLETKAAPGRTSEAFAALELLAPESAEAIAAALPYGKRLPVLRRKMTRHVVRVLTGMLRDRNLAGEEKAVVVKASLQDMGNTGGVEAEAEDVTKNEKI